MELKIASWNIRGIGTKDKQSEIQKLILENNLNICSVLETNAKSKELDKICSKVFNNWSWVTNVTKCRKDCRIVVGSNSNMMNAEVLYMSWQVMYCLAETVQKKNQSFFAAFYMLQTKEKKDLNYGRS
ncbi:RNA-directed DNA polymerase, eukaryota, Reverse transcriptase zinc-binding domain protein [Artemisia annua]|uniref:RNA-directed DNA polymerase, eukaryota, Reverse transcriptase zinc-binding domain protein n=1 Tax=Artemisia annua TaxID=35608 RepID=A0A2U1MMH3_ARTAN|nr:RNA-directed DNA polymerase, eukaryota, Reverse transcriptase zinc-binding domain protein [Artemisia annua]